jgi:AGCS family alanine or glycine:cation symporter
VTGIKRAVFSNEGGVGSAAIAHSAAKTDEPVREGIVAMVGPFIDTIVVCFMTASVILITQDLNPLYIPGDNSIRGAELTSAAFGSVISWFPFILSVVVFLFSYSTMISWYYYGNKGWKYIFGGKSIPVYQVLYLSFTVLGAIASLGNVIDFSDMMILSCAFPNIIGAIFLLPKIKDALDDYWDRYNAGTFKTYK